MSKAIKASASPAAVDQQEPRRAVKGAKLEGGRLELTATQEQEDGLGQILGSESPDFQSYLIEHTLRAMALLKENGDLTGGINAGLAIINAVAPANELEAVLAAQMVGANHFAMKSWARAANNSDMAVVQANAAMANKASRTFAMQMEALAKMRRGGEQIVKHVHVNGGGQAVIAGTLNAGKGGGSER